MINFSLIRNFPDLDHWANKWNNLLTESITITPFLRYEYLRTWWDTRGGGEWKDAELAVVLGYEKDDLIGVAPLFFTNSRDNTPTLMLLGSIEVSDYLDILVRPPNLSTFVPSLLNFIKSLPFKWVVLDWHNLPEASPTLALLKTEAERHRWEFYLEQTYHAPYIPLSGNFEVYLANIDKKQRHEIRRKMRRFEEGGRDVRWYLVEDGSSLDIEVDALLKLMSHDPAKAKFLTNAMQKHLRLTCHAAFENNWLQMAFLEIDGEKAACYLNFDYNNRIWVYNSGVETRFRDLSPGWVLLGYLLKWANENLRIEFDFMRGNEDYKYRFGGIDRSVQRVKISR